MSDETSIRFTASAEIQEINTWTRAVNEATDAILRYQAAAGSGTAAGAAPGPPAGTPTGGAPPPPPAPPGDVEGTPSGAPPPSPDEQSGQRRNSSGQVGAGGGGGRRSPVRSGLGFMGTAASTALGVGLGTSVMGLVMAAPQKYMALDSVLTQLSRRFREVDGSVGVFGESLAYTISETAQFANVLGSQTNAFTRDQFESYGGFARFTGAAPGAAMSAFGMGQRLQGRGMSTDQLTAILVAAERRGMNQGRLDEFLQGLERTMAEGFERTGQSHLGTALAATILPAMVYGQNDPRRSADMTMTQGVHGMFQDQGMQVYLQRAMGYGREDGPSYVEMRKRLHAGVYDARNLVDLFGSFRDRGLNQDQVFRALESAAGGKLAPHQLEALSAAFMGNSGNFDALAEYASVATLGGGDDPRARKAMLDKFDKLDPETRKMFEEGGFFGIRDKGIAKGDRVEQQMERLLMEVGKPMAESIPALLGVLEGSMGTLVAIAEATNLPEAMTSIMEDLETIAKGVEWLAKGSGTPAWVKRQEADAAENRAWLQEKTGVNLDTILDGLNSQGEGLRHGGGP